MRWCRGCRREFELVRKVTEVLTNADVINIEYGNSGQQDFYNPHSCACDMHDAAWLQPIGGAKALPRVTLIVLHFALLPSALILP